jgi:hypothetical protein
MLLSRSTFRHATFRAALRQDSIGSFTGSFASVAFKQSDQVDADIRDGIGSCCDHECKGFVKCRHGFLIFAAKSPSTSTNLQGDLGGRFFIGECAHVKITDQGAIHDGRGAGDA